MKYFFILIQSCLCFLLISKNVTAQTTAAPVAKIASDENLKKQSANNSTSSIIKEPSKPVLVTLKKSDVPTVASATVPNTSKSTVKAVEIGSNNKGVAPKNADKPKVSTFLPVRKAGVLTKPTAKKVQTTE